VDTVEGSTPSEAQKLAAQEEPGMGSPGHPKSSASTGVNLCVRDRASERESQRPRMSTIETDEQLVREPLGTSWLKDGADVAVPRRSPEGRGTSETGGPHGRTDGWAVRDEQP
jgi:hypothetical protein